MIDDESIDLIASHPPYTNIISYSSRKKWVEGVLSFARSLEGYLVGIREVTKERFRVLKPGRFCCILVGDTRRHIHRVQIAFRILQTFLNVGFILMENIMKYQWRTKSTRERWAGLSKVAEECWVDIDKKEGKYTDFFLLVYEHLFCLSKTRNVRRFDNIQG